MEADDYYRLSSTRSDRASALCIRRIPGRARLRAPKLRETSFIIRHDTTRARAREPQRVISCIPWLPCNAAPIPRQSRSTQQGAYSYHPVHPAASCTTVIIYPVLVFQERRVHNACSHLHPRMTEQMTRMSHRVEEFHTHHLFI